MEIENLSIKMLKPYPKNAKKHSHTQVKNVAESIKEFGWQQPIVVDDNYTIIIGHCRYEAAKMLSLDYVPVCIAKGLTEDKANKLRLLDNKTNESEWDYELLLEQIPELDFGNYDALDWGLPEEETEAIEDDFDLDETLSEIKEPISKQGDIWQLGEHRLMCGDSTNPDDVERLMGGGIADLVFTDPPYNVNISNSQGMKIENDNMDAIAFQMFIDKAFCNLSENLKAGGSFYIWHGDSARFIFQQCLQSNGLQVKQCLIWVKNGFNFGRQDYKWKHEPCLYGWKDGAAHYFVEEYNHPTVIEDKIDLNKLKKEELKKLLEQIYSDDTPTTIIHENKPLKNDLHPTMKPVVLCSKLIKHSSRLHEIVLDLFGGSGSTLIACDQIKRRCRMMEYDPVYCDVIIKRWEDFTGKKAILCSKH